MKKFTAFVMIFLLLISSLQFVSLESRQLDDSSNMSTMWTSEINQSSINYPIITVSNQPKMVILAENQPSYVGTTSHLISNFINHDRQIQITYKQNNYSLKLFDTQLHSLEIDSSHYSGWVENDPFSTVSFSYSESANMFSLFIMNGLKGWI